MPDDVAPAPHLARLAEVFAAYPIHQPKTLVVPKKQIGWTVSAALAASGVSWMNLETVTLAEHASGHVAHRLRRAGWRPLPAGAEPFIVDGLLEEHAHLVGDLGGHVPPGLARALVRTIRTLRMAGVSPEALLADRAAGRPRAVAHLYQAYVAYLTEHRLADEAAVFERALAEASALPSPGVLVVFDEVEVPELARRYLSTLQATAEAAHRIAHAGVTAPPPMTAGAHLADDDGWRVERVRAEAADRSWHFAEATGAVCEARGVVRSLLERELPLDTVEIAYPAHDPHLALFIEAARRHDLPMTLAAGTPVLRTRTGQALAAFCRWIEEGLGVQHLVRMLRGGFVATDRVPGLPAPIAPHEVASLVAEHGAGEGPEALARVRQALAAAADGAEPEQVPQLDAAGAVLAGLVRLVPTQASLRLGEMAAACMAFLRRFGPIDLAPETRPSDYTPDEHAHAVLLQRLTVLGEEPGIHGAPRRMAGRLRELVAELFVGARAPQPGHVHVVPLSSAGYAGRPHLFVVGMDEAQFSTRAVQDALLLDEERAPLARRLGTVLPMEGEASGGAAFHFERAAASARRSVTLVASCLDLDADRPLARSASFLEAMQRAGVTKPRRVGFVPPAETPFAIDDLELQLLTRTCAAESTRRFLRARYAACHAGRHAEAHRQGDELTRYDGWLGEEHAEAPGLDPLQRTASATRLEDLVVCPYRFFLKYVLGLRPLREKELEVGQCLDVLEQGSVLHRVFERFVRDLDGEPPRSEHRTEVRALLHDELETRYEARLKADPAAARVLTRRLEKVADVFLNAEVRRSTQSAPEHVELGFGLRPGEAQQAADHEGPLTIPLADGLELRLRGWIDRVDRAPDGTLEVWDYKTGSHKRFEGKDLLQGGRYLQWALYSYALEQLFPEDRVSRAGYYFTSTRGSGQRLADQPDRVRDAIADLLRQRTAMARAGLFPAAPSDETCRYCDYARVCGPATARRQEMQRKRENAEGHPCAEHLTAWDYS